MGPSPDVSSFVELLAALPDPRIDRTRRHSLDAILFLCLCGVVCGANDLVAIEDFGNARRAFLERFVDFPNGIPSHDTIGRVLAKLNPTALEELFTKWMRGVAEATQREVVAIDGKVLRRALDKASGSGFRSRGLFSRIPPYSFWTKRLPAWILRRRSRSSWRWRTFWPIGPA